jgi:hypothetical protein
MICEMTLISIMFGQPIQLIETCILTFIDTKTAMFLTD